MLSKDEIKKIVIKSIQEINLLLEKNKRLKIEKNMCLYGPGSNLDSIGLVNLLVDLEQRLYNEAGVSVSIMDSKAFSLKNSPFRNLDSLVNFIANIGKDK
ncbi:MAG: hypothetical protein HY761_10685 [Candidatus Omnitrophica bacterium]|nr:hypothetical protein [Candidatus Omnitrophota bacterium]